jgi:hypothetical protein
MQAMQAMKVLSCEEWGLWNCLENPSVVRHNGGRVNTVP